MMSDMILKTLSDLCLYFAVVGAFPLLFVRDVFFLIPALLCAAGAGISAALRDRGGIRYLALILPAVCLLWADSLMELCLLTPAAVYTALLIHNAAFDLEYYIYRENFLRMLTGLGIFAAIIFALGYFEGMVGSSWDSYDIAVTLFYGLIHCFTGVFLLRQLRMGTDSRREDRLMNDIQMLVVLCVIIALAAGLVAAEDFLHEAISWLFYTVMAAVGFLPMVIHEIILWFFRDEGRGYVETMEGIRTEPTYTMDMTIPDLQGVPQVQPQEAGFPWWLVFLLLIVLTLMLIFMLRSARKGVKGVGSRQTVESLTFTDQEIKTERRSNRSKIRKLYRNYLKQQRKRGVKLQTNQTSQDILSAAAPDTNTAAAAELRRLYLKARYADALPISGEEVQAAKDALNQTHR